MLNLKQNHRKLFVSFFVLQVCIINRLYEYLENECFWERIVLHIIYITPYVHHFYHNLCFKGRYYIIFALNMREKCMIGLGVEFFVLWYFSYHHLSGGSDPTCTHCRVVWHRQRAHNMVFAAHSSSPECQIDAAERTIYTCVYISPVLAQIIHCHPLSACMLYFLSETCTDHGALTGAVWRPYSDLVCDVATRQTVHRRRAGSSVVIL